MKEIVEGFERRLIFTPAYDLRNLDFKEDYGIHGVEMTFLLIGPLGATHFVLSTNWQLPHIQKELDGRDFESEKHPWCHPSPADLGYHAPTPQREDQIRTECEWVEGGVCYSDGSVLRAHGVYERLLCEGEGGVWKALEEEYRWRFIREDPPERVLMP